jgi:hypothetical protein
MKSAGLLLFLMLLPPMTAGAEGVVNGRRAVVLESETARLIVDLAGGSLVRQRGGSR